jgi:alcohol dehydrogenase, propanol-preferring
MEMGAEAFVDFREEKDVAAKVIEIADGVGVHGVIVTAYQAYKSECSCRTYPPRYTDYCSTAAFDYIGNRKGARIMVIALPPAGEVQISSEPSAFVFKNIHVIGSLVGTMQDTAACLDYARRGLLKPIHEVRGKSQWAESVQQLRRGEIAGRIVIDFNTD